MFEEKRWPGYSRRTYYRTSLRPATLVFLADDAEGRRLHIDSFPTLNNTARIPSEVGRIEFKAFDCPSDPEMYRSLGALLMGLALDDTLPKKRTTPDSDPHKTAATK
jgi:hypothetical protein